MKDYRLSEVKGICSKHKSCHDCELFDYYRGLCLITTTAPYHYEVDEEQPKDKIETLEDTIGLMTSADYKDRFKAEYYQLNIRYEKLDAMVKNWDNLSFEPTCSKETFNTQLEIMLDYLKILELRAMIESIELN